MNFKSLCSTIEEQGGKPRSYSGRGMYGQHCVGVNMDYVGQYTLPKGFNLDNMGLGVIAYWPHVKWEPN